MKLALIENTGKDFFKARMRLAKYLENKGFEVTIIVPNDGYVSKIKEADFNVLSVGEVIRGKGVDNQIKFAFSLYQVIKKNKFDIIHCFRMQPNIIGGFLAGILGHKNVINHITGLGIVFTKTSFKYILQKKFIRLCYKFNNEIFKTKYIFQNIEDVVELGIKRNFKIIRGSGVNEEVFFPRNVDKSFIKKELNIDSQKIIILFASRLIKSKGLDILVNAIKLANKCLDNKLHLLVAGWMDEQNIDTYKQDDINLLNKNHFVHFLGERSDISDLINASDICVLPSSYREGTPRFLLEAMACSKPIITSNVPGCNHLIDKENQNGILIEKNNYLDLNQALIELSNKDLIPLGRNSFKLYKNKFSEEIVYDAIFNFYNT